jgi:hypothetical protein
VTLHTPAACAVTENLFIPLADGTRLAARLWLPDGAETGPVPAVLEYIPYRKRDGTRGRDDPMHGYFARHGLAAIRVDMRGSGESEGLLDDEYLKLEQDDALEVIAWIAAQPWCSGSVGMMGKSWGGFNALQVAARRPPALKAIVTVCSTDDRYTDDIHWMGGCLLNDNLWWGAIMLAYQARPADPEIVGEGWRVQWLERLNQMPFWPALWLKHQRRDAYWKYGSVNEDWSAVEVPTLAVGGWADAYTNAVPRLLEHLQCPRQGIIGPWAHVYAQDGTPGPAIGFLQEMVRWWRQWLAGEDTGVADEPMLRAFVEDHREAGAWADPCPGRWVAEPVWPSPAIAPRTLYLTGEGLRPSAGQEAEVAFRSPQWTGAGAGEWMGAGVPGEQPADQRLDDGFSLVFDTEPLAEDVEILGAPEVELLLASNQPVAQIAVRLTDVAPDGASRRVSYHVLNLTHRKSHEHPEPMQPGQFETVRLALNACGTVFRVGHRIRVALSTAYWPLVWPAPGAATLTLRLGASSLSLPVRTARAEDAAVRFPPPETAPDAPVTLLRHGSAARTATFDLLNRTASYVTRNEGGVFGEGVRRFEEIGTVLSHDITRVLDIAAGDPLCARSRVAQTYEMGREGWDIRIEVETEMTATAGAFRLVGRLEAFENDVSVAVREWEDVTPRDLV